MKYLRWIGLAMSLLGIGFVVVQLGAYADDLGDFRPSIVQLLVLVSLAVIYGISNVALAVAWRDLLEHCGAPSGMKFSTKVFKIKTDFHFIVQKKRSVLRLQRPIVSTICQMERVIAIFGIKLAC